MLQQFAEVLNYFIKVASLRLYNKKGSILLTTAVGTINEDGTPHLTTMWYPSERFNDTDIILMNTKGSRVKERNMRRNPFV